MVTSTATAPLAAVESLRTDRVVSTAPVVNGVLVCAWVLLSYAAGKTLLGFSNDYVEYLLYYESIPPTFSLLDTRFEPGFHAVAWIFRNWLKADISTLIMSLAAVSLGIKFALFRKYLERPLTAALLYTVLFYPIHEYTQYRVGISLALGFFAVHLLLEKRYRWAALLFVLSFSFHYSSIALALVAVGGLLFRGRIALVAIFVAALIGSIALEQLRFRIADLFDRLNPLSASYLDNKAMIEGVSIFSVNNLLLIGAVVSYIFAGFYTRSRYHALFLTLTIACLAPIVLLPESPVIAQRSKEVLFVAVVFLACRSRLRLPDLPGFAFVVAMTGLLGYLWVAGGIILS